MEFAGDILLQLMIIHRSLHSLFADTLDIPEISQHYHVLLVLNRIGGVATQIELIAYLKANESTLRASISVLEKKGYVTKSKSNRDQRSQLIKVTNKTRMLMVSIQDAISIVDKTALKNFERDDLFQFLSALIKIRDNIATVSKA
ncbi:MarR family winged helix-turn-helix transcriptional regulator [Mucilaginibacter sp. PAMB04274]|uniref:MarR family winged helix-turn-helix transcriptional regulator n=1 Tax=Mucilaginibacter sp. PAMB04274 TaxID=3138568 RepID=UPI0031F65A2C